MKNLMLFMGFGLIMAVVMSKALLEFRRRQQQHRPQITVKPHLDYFSARSIVHS